MQSTKNVTQAKPSANGAISVAPVGTTLPTDAVTELDEAFKNLGYITEDGVTNAESIESTNTKAWGGDVVLTSQTNRTDTFAYKMMEALNTDVLKMYYGDQNVNGTLESGISIKSNSLELEPHAFVIDELLSNNVLMRTVIPNGKVTSKEAIEHKGDNPLLFGITITALPDDDSKDGDTHYTYIKKKAAA